MEQQIQLPKLRTIQGCLDFIKKQDEQTAITLYYIRCLCKDKKVKYELAGNKILVNLDSLLNTLNATISQPF